MKLDLAAHQRRVGALGQSPAEISPLAVAVLLAACGLGLMLWLG